MFDAVNYIKTLKESCIDTQDYQFAQVTGLSHLEEVISNSKRHDKFVAIDDTDEGVTFKIGGAFYERRMYTVFILLGFDLDDMDDRKAKMATARDIFRTFLSKINVDSQEYLEEQLVYFDNDKIDFYEFPGYAAAQATGLYFSFTVEHPIELIYDGSKWQ